jgi:hypothetical protein
MNHNLTNEINRYTNDSENKNMDADKKVNGDEKVSRYENEHIVPHDLIIAISPKRKNTKRNKIRNKMNSKDH